MYKRQALFCRVPLARKNGGAPPLPLRALARKGVFYALLAALSLIHICAPARRLDKRGCVL